MAVISTFNQWQKDVFFSAAEEVQESADNMESMYRMWVRERLDGLNPEILDELRRELHTTLGTAKWQLEDFERAVSLSHRNYPCEENTITRHRAFVEAIRDKISRVEKEVEDSLVEEGKQSLRWVQLDEEERDDLEIFLSSAANSVPKETVTTIVGSKYDVEIVAKEDEVILEEAYLNGHAKEDSSSDIGCWRISIPDEYTRNRASGVFSFVSRVDLSGKLRWFRNSFRKAKSREDHLKSRGGLPNYLDLKGIPLLTQGIIHGLSERSRNCFRDCKQLPSVSSSQQVGRVGGLHQQFHGLQLNKHSLRFALLLNLAVFFIVGRSKQVLECGLGEFGVVENNLEGTLKKPDNRLGELFLNHHQSY